MFINLTNHPSALWDENQLAAARQYGEIEDLSFPDVLPTATAAEVQQLADHYTSLIIEMAGSKPAVVHVMGEMTFTTAVVSRLKAEGIKCVASTTERNTITMPDGKKVSEFRFVQFREY